MLSFSKRTLWAELLRWAPCGVGFLGLLALVLFSAPSGFPVGRTVRIDDGATLSEAALQLRDERVVRFSSVLRALVAVYGGSGRVQAGEYVFSKRLGAAPVAWRITRGVFGIDPVRVRLPEGVTRTMMADILEENLPRFDRARFLALTYDKEGYLFPDTYFFLQNATAEEVAEILSTTFTARTNELQTAVEASGHSFEDIVIMASLIEREAHDPEDRRIISGILWKRIDIGMPLQVDAPFVFLSGKASHELTRDDLATTSPYNTYVHAGLPPGPIANPSLDALYAALEPAVSDYLYYLSDEDGVTHYAADFEAHKKNKVKYIP